MEKQILCGCLQNRLWLFSESAINNDLYDE